MTPERKEIAEKWLLNKTKGCCVECGGDQLELVGEITIQAGLDSYNDRSPESAYRAPGGVQ